MPLKKILLLAGIAAGLAGCGGGTPAPAGAPTTGTVKATAADAAKFIDGVNAEYAKTYPEQTAAGWVKATYITGDTQLLEAKQNERALALLSRQIEESKRFVGLAGIAPDVARQLLLLKISTSLPAPSDPAKLAELTQIASRMDGAYGAGKYCPPGKSECLTLDDLEKIIDDPARSPAERTEAWAGWHGVGRGIRKDYVRFAELANQGASELGFHDLGDLWRAGYDMKSEDFNAETERLWGQVKPLYEQLHCYVRTRLNAKYGDAVVPKNGLIPAQLLGNMWAQSWENVYPQVEPYPGIGSLDVGDVLKAEREATYTKLLAEKYPKAKPTPEQLAAVGHDADAAESRAMARRAEDFYTSIGFPKLPDSFWAKSMLTRPRDRDVVCHASAWDLDQHGDVRIKMCITPSEENLTTIHHEMGHVYYFLMYNGLPPLFQNGAHDGFHEAIGDTITLSITPKHLQKIGLVKDVKEDQKALINAQMKRALEKIAFLPFGKLIDQWRWKVFSGEIAPADYNKGWWKLRESYQGIAPPLARSEEDFDPGAKYHVPGNTPYTRYFLSFIVQFQFHKALCDAAGFKGPLYECDIYGNKDAGAKFAAMLKKGASQPWPQTLKELTGGEAMDASAITEYFAPLQAWLKQQNEGQSCGWEPAADPLAGPAQSASAQ
ncbi:MAG: M2 family metallopeptidase [Nevskia sp.]